MRGRPLIAVNINLSRFRAKEDRHVEFMSDNDVNRDGSCGPCAVV
jgi:hypothetical protein